jgi:hypothetical protein
MIPICIHNIVHMCSQVLKTCERVCTSNMFDCLLTMEIKTRSESIDRFPSHSRWLKAVGKISLTQLPYTNEGGLAAVVSGSEKRTLIAKEAEQPKRRAERSRVLRLKVLKLCCIDE